MYVPRAFQADSAEVEAFLADVAFALLVTVGDGKPVATHLPVEYVRESGERAWIYGHLARRNPQWRDLEDRGEALVVAQGAHGYVSPAWYHERDVPTWNYQAVHVYGVPEFLDERAFRAMLEHLVSRHESRRDDPVRLSDYPEAFIESQMRGAVGFRLRVTRIEGAFKLSQNKSEADRLGVRRGLEREGPADLADAMGGRSEPGSGRSD